MNNWQSNKLGEVADITGGGTPPTTNAQHFTGNVPWFTPSEITSGTVSVLTNSQRQITEEATKYSKIAEQGTVLLSSRATIGHVGIVDKRSTYNQGIKGLTPKKELLSWYLAYWLLANKKKLEKSSFGTTFKELSTTALKKFDIKIPPIAIQQQIIEKLDAIKLMKELTQKEIIKIEELFNSYLAKGAKLNENKQIKKLGDLVDVITKGATPTTYGHNFTKDGIPFLRVENVNNGIINPSGTTHHIDGLTNMLLKRSKTHEYDVLITIAGTIGRVGYIPKGAFEMNMNQAVAIIRVKPDLLNFLYLFYFLQTKELQRQLTAARVVGTITNISLTTLKDLDIPCPTIDEQIKIAGRLDHLMTYKKLLLQKQMNITKLFESMLNKLMRSN